MLAAFYSKDCDSHELFDNLAISGDKAYEEHLNRYNVIYLNMQDFLSASKSLEEMIAVLTESLMIDFEDCFPDVKLYPIGYLGYRSDKRTAYTPNKEIYRADR